VNHEKGMDKNMNCADYRKFRGKCKEFVDQAVKDDPSLTAVRGHYYCPMWGKQAHWWCVRPDGTVYDPTVAQFPRPHIGEYVPFDGTVECAECGRVVGENFAKIDGRYAFCSYECNAKFVGVFPKREPNKEPRLTHEGRNYNQRQRDTYPHIAP